MTRTKHTTKSQAVPAILGIDLAKRSVHVHGVDESEQPCVDRKMTPKALRKWLANLPPCVIGLEACGRAHQWAREIQALGHEVRLVSPQFVKPYVLTNK